MPSVGVWLSVEAITGRIADVRVNICFLLELVRDCQQQVNAADTGPLLECEGSNCQTLVIRSPALASSTSKSSSLV